MQLKEHSLDHLSFEERLGLLVDIEYTSRKNNRLKRLIRNANFDQSYACIADINYSAGRKLDKALIDRLATCTFITDKHNIIIMGASGAGKSYLACAFGMEACKQYYTVKYVRLPELLTDLAIARGEGVYKKVLSQYRKVDLLILDEWMFVSLTETEARDLLELIHACHKRASTIFCSQFSPAGWHSKIGEATLADAILDRIVHDSYTIEIGDGSDRSMREVYGINGKGR
ncbi:MAG: hypothetical protein PWQ60_1813 [Thermoanaerobacteraceae bacterium]|nr:hypothetical protein [Thermoanaerobacteraceae bacterium]